MNACVALILTLPFGKVSPWTKIQGETKPKSACRQEGPGLQHVQWMQSKREDPGPPKAAVTQEKWLEKMDKGQGSSRERCSTEMSLQGL